MFYKKGVLRNLAKFTGKHLRQSLFFNNVAGLRPASVTEFSVFAKFFIAGNKAKGQILNRVLKKAKYAKFSERRTFFTP